MRSVKKETVDELARVIRKYWATGDTDILDLKHKKASELSEQAFGNHTKWLQFCDILNGAICLNRNVSNDTIYKIFGLLCIEVSAPVEAGVVAGPPDGMTGLKGCWHCRNIEAHHIEYVIAAEAKGGTPMNMPVDCPYHYCPACGRKLEVEG